MDITLIIFDSFSTVWCDKLLQDHLVHFLPLLGVKGSAINYVRTVV